MKIEGRGCGACPTHVGSILNTASGVNTAFGVNTAVGGICSAMEFQSGQGEVWVAEKSGSMIHDLNLTEMKSCWMMKMNSGNMRLTHWLPCLVRV